jgi:hypothetical protein
MQYTFTSQLVPVVASVVADSREASQRAGLIASQLLGLALTRHILRLPPVVALDRAVLVEQIGPTIQRYLTG